MNDQEIRTKAREIIGKCTFPAFATVDEDQCPQIRAMMPVAVEEDFTLHYITGRMSSKCGQIKANPKVSTLWTHVVEPMRDWQSVLIKGQASITDDKALRERHWMDELKMVFPGGVDDPNYVILIVKPTEMILADQQTMPPLVVNL